MKIITIIDLEWNSWKFNYNIGYKLSENREKWQHKDLLQIGAINFNPKTYEIKGKLNILIKPKFNPKLNYYIVTLLNLNAQYFKRHAISFKRAHERLINFTKNSSFIICNGDDGLIYKKNLEYNKIKDLRINFLNIRNVLKKKYTINEKNISSPNLHNLIKKNESYRPHNPIDDAMSILSFLKTKKETFNFSRLLLNK